MWQVLLSLAEIPAYSIRLDNNCNYSKGLDMTGNNSHGLLRSKSGRDKIMKMLLFHLILVKHCKGGAIFFVGPWAFSEN